MLWITELWMSELVMEVTALNGEWQKRDAGAVLLMAHLAFNCNAFPCECTGKSSSEASFALSVIEMGFLVNFFLWFPFFFDWQIWSFNHCLHMGFGNEVSFRNPRWWRVSSSNLMGFLRLDGIRLKLFDWNARNHDSCPGRIVYYSNIYYPNGCLESSAYTFGVKSWRIFCMKH